VSQKINFYAFFATLFRLCLPNESRPVGLTVRIKLDWDSTK